MRLLFQLSTLALASSLLFGACLRDQKSPLQQTALRSPFNALKTLKEPVFGNTATNLRRIQQKPYNGNIRFVVMGDNRNSSPFSHGGDKIYAKVIEKVNQLQPDFTVNLGDFTFDNLSPHWRDFEKITSNVKTPYLTVVGNHPHFSSHVIIIREKCAAITITSEVFGREKTCSANYSHSSGTYNITVAKSVF